MKADRKTVHAEKRTAGNILRATMIVLALIGVVMVIRRTMALAGVIPSSFNPSGGPALDSSFSQHKAVTLIHILPGLLFMILGPLQFMPHLRRKHIQFHRWNGRIFLIAAFVVGVSAICLPFVLSPIGGLTEATGTLVFGTYFLLALTKAWTHIRRKNIVLHRKWMIRAFATGLAVSTIRPIIALFFALSDMRPEEFFGIAFWIGFCLHVAAAEWWIHYTRKVSL